MSFSIGFTKRGGNTQGSCRLHSWVDWGGVGGRYSHCLFAFFPNVFFILTTLIVPYVVLESKSSGIQVQYLALYCNNSVVY